MVQLALCLNGAAMSSHDVLGDCEAQTSAARFARARLVDPVEALEQPWQMLAGNSGAKIANVKLNAILCFAGADQDPASILAIFHSVIDQVAEHLMNCVAIHQNR